MLDQILTLVKAHGETTIVNNPDVPNEQNDAALGIAAQSIFSGIQDAVSKGNLSQLMGIIGSSQNAGENVMEAPIVKEMLSSFIGQLKSQLSLAPDKAQSVASSTISKVLSGIQSQFGGANEGAPDLMALAQGFLSGQAGASLSSLTASLDVNKDGSVDMKDAMDQLGGGDGSALAGVAGRFLSGMLK